MESRLTTTFALERAMENLGQELRNAVPLGDPRFAGKGEEIGFTTSQGPTQLIQIRYRLAPDGSSRSLVRESQPFPPADSSVQLKTLVKQVVRFSLVYAMIKEEGGKSSLQWVQAWEDKAPQQPELPGVVKVQLEALDSKGRPCSVIREFLIPHGVLRNLAVEA